MAIERLEQSTTSSLVYQDRFLTRQQAAVMLGIAASTLACWRSDGREDAPPMRKHGKRAVYSEKELLAWSESQKS